MVWRLDPHTAFFALVQRNFPLTQADPVHATDLAPASGSRILGGYELVW